MRSLNIGEDCFQAKLFNRSSTGIEITAAGQEVMTFAERLKRELGELSTRVRSFSEKEAQALQIAVTEACWSSRFLMRSRFSRDRSHRLVSVFILGLRKRSLPAFFRTAFITRLPTSVMTSSDFIEKFFILISFLPIHTKK